MNKHWQKLEKWLNSRQVGERAILLGALVLVFGMVWLTFAHDVLVAKRADADRGITVVNSQIAEERNKQAEIRGTYTTDPNSFARTRQAELRSAAQTADARLNALYGDLISPQQMSRVLTSILQHDTTLKLISLENQPSEALVTSTPAEGGADLQVFKHGLRMVFEGNFLETVRYLRSLEELDGSFFWDNLEYTRTEYPNGRISLDIYTLSTQQGWIGV